MKHLRRPTTFGSCQVSLKLTCFNELVNKIHPWESRLVPDYDNPQYVQTTQLIIWTAKWLSSFLGQFTDGWRSCSFLARTLVCQPINQRPSVVGGGADWCGGAGAHYPVTSRTRFGRTRCLWPLTFRFPWGEILSAQLNGLMLHSVHFINHTSL